MAGPLSVHGHSPSGGGLGFPTWRDRALTRGGKAAVLLGLRLRSQTSPSYTFY